MTIIVGDCREVLATLEADSIDAIVTDPPYGIGFMGREWDSSFASADMPMRRNPQQDAVNAGAARQGGRQRAGVDYQRRMARDSREFQAWTEAWATEAFRVLRPGGHLLSFGGTRTYHRMVCGVEDAGFEIRDQLAWLFGVGFPKSRNVGEGRGTALKPAHEPIVLARKPLVGTVAANVAGHGTGALSIDACRIGTEDGANLDGGRISSSTDGWDRPYKRDAETRRNVIERGADKVAHAEALGRWPANVVLDEEAAKLLDEQTGELVSGANPIRRGTDKFRGVYGDFAGQAECEPNRGRDAGGASRFFYCAKTSTAERNAGLEPSLLTPAGAPDRNNHPTVKPIALMRWLTRLVTPPGGTILDPFTGSGTTGCACALEGFEFLGVELDPEYVRIAEARIAFWAEHGDDALRIVADSERSQAEREVIAESGQLDLLG